MVKPKIKRAAARIVEEDPVWLRRDPEGPAPPPPVRPKAQVLPFLGLEWRDFERLCRRLADTGGTVEAAQAYGTPGQAQLGIDVLVRLTDGTFEVWQTKRHRTFSAARLRSAISLFLKHKWAGQAKKFVLAVACDLETTDVVDAIEAARDQLRAKSILLEPLGATQLTERLRSEPTIVDDFFDRPWVLATCPAEALEALSNRISRFTRSTLRASLRDCYRSWGAAVDPGIPIAGLDQLGRALPAPPLEKRYIKPDVLRMVSAERVGESTDSKTMRAPPASSNAGTDDNSQPQREPRSGAIVVREQRVSMDSFLASTDRAIIAANAGVGKSTFLRMLSLDILSDTPQFESVRERYANFIPVWVSFPLWTRMASGHAVPPALLEAVTEFLRAQSHPELAEDMRRAIAGQGIVLLVDGLDEATDTTAAQTVATLLAAFVESRGCPTFVTSRPHGLRAASSFAGTWARVELAPLSDAQRRDLCKLWFRVLEDLESGGEAEPSRLERRAEQRASTFSADLRRNPGIARLSQTPLFLLAMVDLHRHGRQLPRSRFAAIERIVDQLVEHQPQRRATGALQTNSLSANARLRDRVLADFAFGLQAGQLNGVVTDAATEEAAVARAAEVVLRRQGSQDRDSADAATRAVFEFAEERAGLLVKKAPGNVGFLHLALQEYLAGKHILQFPLEDRIVFIRTHAAESRWREPILYLLYLVANEAEVGKLLQAIKEAQASSLRATENRDALLTDAVFADIAHDDKVSREIANDLLMTSELTGWGGRQRHVLSSAVEGLATETLAALCRAKIAEWVPDRFGYGRGSALRAMVAWPESLRESSFGILMRSLIAEEGTTRAAAAEALAKFAGSSHDPKHRLLRFIKEAPSPVAIATSLYSLGRGWSQDADVGDLAAAAQGSSDPAVAFEAIRVRARRMETDDADFNRFFEVTYRQRPLSGMGDLELIGHFATRVRESFTARLHEGIERSRDRNPHDLRPLIGSLVMCDPDDPLVAPGMLDLLKHDWNIRELFSPGHFPVEKVRWTPELVAEIERFGSGPNAHFHDYELYYITKIVRTEVLKAQIIRSLEHESSFRFWSARALVEAWGADDKEVSTALLRFLGGGPEQIASVADALPAVVSDKSACRAALLAALRGRPHRVDLIFSALRQLGVSSDDHEAFEAAQQAWSGLNAPLWQDQWRAHMIYLFPRRSEVRTLALEELTRRDGAIGAVAENYVDDAEITSQLMRVLGPQPAAAREQLISTLQTTAVVNDAALAALTAAREDTESAVSFEATIGWVEGLVARGPLEAPHVDWLVKELSAVGPDYESRRAAAVIGLAIGKHLDRFANATDHQGKPLIVSASRVSLRADDRYLRRVLEQWNELVQALGTERQVLERLELTPDALLPVIDPNQPNAQRVFDLVMQMVPSSPHLSRHIPLAAVARFGAGTKLLRDMVLTALTNIGRQHWEVLVAGEIFAEQFSEDADLRHRVVEHSLGAPHGMGEAVIAELLLRHPDPELETALRAKIMGARYDIATHFKLVAALSGPQDVVQELKILLSKDFSETNTWQFPRWVPAIVRRTEKDAAVRDALHVALTRDVSATVKVSFVSLLGQGAGVDDRLRAFIGEELRRAESAVIPNVGFDLLSQSHRLVRQLLAETLG